MSRSYTPGLKILSRTKIVKRRQLPMKGDVHLKIGDIVKLSSMRPTSKRKRWSVGEIIRESIKIG